MRALVLAYHSIGCVCLEELLAQGENVVAVFTHDDDPHENIWFRSVREVAQANSLSVFAPQNINSPQWVEQIRVLKPDILFSFYYRHLVSNEILAIPPLGCFNLHGSLLPRYRGCAPVNWAIICGEKETGVTLHHMIARLDAGNIVAQQSVRIGFEDNARTLLEKLTVIARDVLREILPLLRTGNAPSVPQDLSKGRYFRRRTPDDGLIDWRWSAIQIYNMARALTHPYPGAFTSIAGRKLIIWNCHPLTQGEPQITAGRVLSADRIRQVAHVQTGDGALRLERIQFECEEECAGNHLPIGVLLGQ
jgi:methionyl-tRNA formyltransferase